MFVLAFFFLNWAVNAGFQEKLYGYVGAGIEREKQMF